MHVVFKKNEANLEASKNWCVSNPEQQARKPNIILNLNSSSLQIPAFSLTLCGLWSHC